MKISILCENYTSKMWILAEHELSLLIESGGIYIILGCSHPGIINCVKHAKKLFKDEKILSIIGGFHLSNTSTYNVKKIISELRALDVNDTTIMHCTGFNAYFEFKQEYKDNCRYLSSGEIISF